MTRRVFLAALCALPVNVSAKEHTGGWPSREAYRAAWARVQCVVCAERGFKMVNGREEDFEMVVVHDGRCSRYAHRPTCYEIGMKDSSRRRHPRWRQECPGDKP